MAVGTIYFALVDPAEIFSPIIHNREDEDVFKLVVSQSEGSFARAEVEIKNPSQGLLLPTRKQHAFISYQDGASVILLFAGRITGFPSDITKEIINLEYIAQPDDWEVQQAAFLQTLKTAPQYNTLFIPEERRNEASEILSGRAELLHWTRDTHILSTSDIIQGSSFLDLAQEVFFDTISTEIGDPPTTQINLNIEAQWEQTGIGTVDVGTAIKAQFTNTAIATPEINTLTPLAFEDGWKGVQVPKGYTIQETKLSPVSNSFGLAQANLRSVIATVNGIDFPTKTGGNPISRTVSVPRVWYEGTLVLQAEYQQKRREVATATVLADTQGFSLKGNEEEDLTIRIQNPTAIAQGSVHDSKLPSFFYDVATTNLTVLGRAAIEHGLSRALARLKKSSRMVEYRFEADLDLTIGVTLDHSIRIVDNRLPGGSIRGKVIQYLFSIDGNSGQSVSQITLGAVIGKGASSAPIIPPSLTEVELGAISYDNEFGATPMNSSLFYDLVTLPTIDEPIDVALMESNDQYLITATTLANDGESQNNNFDDNPPNSRPDLNLGNNPTGITVDLRSLNPSAELFKQIQIDTQPYTLPRQIDMEAT